jgi:hypothetical protein
MSYCKIEWLLRIHYLLTMLPRRHTSLQIGPMFFQFHFTAFPSHVLHVSLQQKLGPQNKMYETARIIQIKS